MKKTKKITILGFGVEGKATAEYLFGEDCADITILDKNTEEKKYIEENFPKAEIGLGEDYLKTIKNTVKEFKGLEHRLEFVAEKDGISFYNDSFATVPESAIAAIKSFSKNIILIAGGSSKNSDYSELGKEIAEGVKATILIGETTEEIELEIRRGNKEIRIIKGLTKMEDMVKAGLNNAVEGDVVLLSPASASFGLFKNYNDRGEQFKEAVNQLIS